MDYIEDMTNVILACDRMQGSVRLYTVNTPEELNTIYPLLSLYEQIEHVNYRCFLQGIITRNEYEHIRSDIMLREQRYKEWINELGGKVK